MERDFFCEKIEQQVVNSQSVIRNTQSKTYICSKVK